ncbi:MAG: transporter [Pseudonocardiales bacterium]|nr:transporter [Pseudonocardiales bacterium]
MPIRSVICSNVTTSSVERQVSPGLSAVNPVSSRRYLVFGVTSIALFMASIDQTIVATALNTLQHDLHTSVNWSSWTITVYALGQILVMPLAGALSDTYGRKELFIIAVTVFIASSLCCGLSTNIYELVAFRAVQALGGGAFMPSATGIVADEFGANRDRAIGMFTSIFPIGAIVGPVLGGVFVTYWSWRAIFLVNLPIGAVLVVLAAVFIPGSAKAAQHRLDVVGVAEIGVGLLGVMGAISYLGSRHGSVFSPWFATFLLVGVGSLVAFVRHSTRAEHPFVPSRLLRGRGFATMNIINFFIGAAVLGFASLVPLYAQNRYQLPALSAGTLLTARALGMIGVSAMAVFAMRRTGCRLPMIIGVLVTALGTALLAFLPNGIQPYTWLAVAAATTGLGTGIAMPAANNATLQLAPENAASISGLRGMFRQAGGITGLAIAGSVVARSADPGHAQAMMFLAIAVVLVLLIPLILLVPEHRGAW